MRVEANEKVLVVVLIPLACQDVLDKLVIELEGVVVRVTTS